MLNPHRLDADLAMVLVVDVQARLMPTIHDGDDVIARTAHLLHGAAIFSLPTLATEQYPAGLGGTVPAVADALQTCNAEVLEKDTFSCCGDAGVRDALRVIDRPQVIVCGVEAHVCVQQTALDLLSLGHTVFLCADAVGSRVSSDRQIALDRMRHAGANVTTVESALFELCAERTDPRFKQLLELVKSSMAQVSVR